jgi:tellurite resistance protein TehA-like permease
VSLACLVVGWELVARAALWLNTGFFVVLWVLLAARVARHRRRVVADLLDHGRSVGFFTMVAATSVLGSQFVLIGGYTEVALALWVAAIALWALLTYAIFTIITVKADKPALADGINGGWLVAVVAAQSVCVLGAQLAPHFPDQAERMLTFCLAMWLGGGMLYLWIIGMIFYRYTFFALEPSDLAPPYWINMGAAAISGLAGTMLIAAAPHSPVLAQVLPFVRGLTLMWWATATWWIPMLLILGIWRHVVRRFPLRYDPLYWGAVFPIGMYTVVTARLSVAVDAPYLFSITRAFVYVAVAAWSLAAVGMIVHVAGNILRRT